MWQWLFKCNHTTVFKRFTSNNEGVILLYTMEVLSKEQIQQRLGSDSGWNIGENAISKTFSFSTFKDAVSFMVRVGFECEALDHHPDWKNAYNRIDVSLTTHSVNGVTDKDITVAELMDRIYNNPIQ